MLSHIEDMSPAIDQKDCFTQPVNEASHGKALFFLGYDQQNSNFVRFGGRLDNIFGHTQSIQKARFKNYCIYNTLMNKILQNNNLEQFIFRLNQIIFSKLKENCVPSAIPIVRTITKKLQNKEV